MRLSTHQILRPLIVAVMAMLGFVQQSSAQGRFFYSNGVYEPEWLLEAGISPGVMNAITDIQGNPRRYQGPVAGATTKKSNFAFGLYANAIWKDLFGVRIEATVGKIQGFDSLLKNATAPSAIGRYERNLNFRTPIREIAVMAEIHPATIFRSEEKGPPILSPYVFAGLSWFTFNPQGYTANGWVDLHPLHLEGQGFAEYPDRKEYKLNSFAYPIGIGFRYDLSAKITLRLEFSKRTTFTDYLDDVHEPDWVDPTLFPKYLAPAQAALAQQLYNRSTVINPPRNTRPRGNPKENDAFWTTSLKIGINLNRSSSSSGIFGGSTKKDMRKRLRCPNW